MIVSALDTLTSIISGLVIFSVLGALSFEMGLDMKDVVKSGPGLAFVAYPEALSRLPLPHLWSVLFFLMLFILGLDSEFAILENIVTSLSDEIHCLRKHKLKVTIAVGAAFFLFGLPVVTRGGQYIFEILDYYGGSISLVFIAVVECIAISWIYGYENFSSDINFMLSKNMGIYWRITWKFTAPLTLLFIAIYSLVIHTPLQYGAYQFPNWTDVVGWAIVFVVISQIIVWALFHVIRSCKQECCKCLEAVFAPDKDWGPKDPIVREEWRVYKRNLKVHNFELEHVYITNL
ncbi:sodium- and chloride-dependent glycine transporter 2-like protein [Leptotrombidium deliense]|uniref:Sodium-dependent nutrient amino acid transporter 1 n=1 Tax=Leptotrombidium deliense TaxID=299467 RepID=A0A443RX93_9ACAR|nr:sodium- and chloride-dependent glycine transporter 2-like protein [Leptotrombidium deliense]